MLTATSPSGSDPLRDPAEPLPVESHLPADLDTNSGTSSDTATGISKFLINPANEYIQIQDSSEDNLHQGTFVVVEIPSDQNDLIPQIESVGVDAEPAETADQVPSQQNIQESFILPTGTDHHSTMENIRHDHNLAKTVPVQQFSEPSPSHSIIISNETGQHIQTDGQIIQIISDPNCNLMKPLAMSNSAQPFILPPGYQLLSVDPTLPSFTQSYQSSLVTTSTTTSNNSSTSNSQNVEFSFAKIQEKGNHNLSAVQDRNHEGVGGDLGRRSLETALSANTTITINACDATFTLQRYFYQKGLCRVCLMEKEETTSIFEDVTVDENGFIENSRGPQVVRYNIIPAIKTLLDIEVVYGDGLPDQICNPCLDTVVTFSAFRKTIALGQSKLGEVISQVQGSNNPTFIPDLGEPNFCNTDIFRHPKSIMVAKNALITSKFAHLVQRNIPDRIWDKIFSTMALMTGMKSEKLKCLEAYAYASPYVVGWFCSTCNVTIHASQDDFENHYISLHQIQSTESLLYPCDICGSSYPLVDSSALSEDYSEHWLRHFFLHACTLCPKLLPSSKSLSIHKQTAHTVYDKSHICDICSKPFAKKAHLEAHRKTHLQSNERELNSCDICGKRFASSLTTHMQNAHSEEKRWTCENCGKGFKRKSILNNHRKAVHLKQIQKKFQCEICGESLRSSAAKSIHVLRHQGEKRYTCEICGQKFYSKYALNSHSYRHKQEKDFNCPVPDCGKSFKRKIYLTEHLKLHTGDKPYSCPICGKSIRIKGNLSKHLKVHTKKQQEEEKKRVSKNTGAMEADNFENIAADMT